MAERFGRVVYWCGCLFAAAVGVLALYVWNDPGVSASNRPIVLALLAGVGFISWAIGRAARYVLSGD